VLFSEPKIPQSNSIEFWELDTREFQCSSASRKFLNLLGWFWRGMGFWVSVLFSEPKIPQLAGYRRVVVHALKFQCSSASRKFLNFASRKTSSNVFTTVSVLFSKPKIPQSSRTAA